MSSSIYDYNYYFINMIIKVKFSCEYKYEYKLCMEF